MDKPGYDAGTRVLFEPSIAFPAIPPNPTFADAEAARKLLLDPACATSRSILPARKIDLAGRALLSGTPIASGPTPLLLIEHQTPRGTGKSKLCDIIGALLCGHAMTIMPMADNDEEMRKQITTHMMAGTRLIQIDNIEATKGLGCASLDVLLTAIGGGSRQLAAIQRWTCLLRQYYSQRGITCICRVI